MSNDIPLDPSMILPEDVKPNKLTPMDVSYMFQTAMAEFGTATKTSVTFERGDVNKYFAYRFTTKFKLKPEIAQFFRERFVYTFEPWIADSRIRSRIWLDDKASSLDLENGTFTQKYEITYL